MQENSRVSVFENISFYILLAMTFLIPIFFVPVTFISIQFGTSLLFALGVIAAFLFYIAGVFTSGSLPMPQPARYAVGLTLLVPIVYVLAGISNGFSRMVFFGYTFDISTVGFIILGFVYLILMSVLANSKQRIFYSYLSFLLSSLIFSLFLLVRVLFGAKALSFGIFTDLTLTPLGSWNSVGIFFGMTALLALLSQHILRLSKLMKGLLLLALVFSLFFLTLVNFTIVWYVLAVSSFLFVLYNFFLVREDTLGIPLTFGQKFKKLPVYSVVVCLISIAFIIWGASLGGYFAKKFNVNNVDVRPSLSVTLDIARSTIQNRPLFGSGPNTFVTQWLSYKPDDITATIFWNTDFAYGIGLLPTFAVTTGLFGVLSWLLFFGFYIYTGIKSIFMKIEDTFEKFLMVSSFFISLYLWILAIVYVPSTAVFVLTFFFTGLFYASVYVGGVIRLNRVILTSNPRQGYVLSVILIALTIGTLSLGVGLFKNSQSLWYFQKSSYALNNSKDVAGSVALMQKAIDAVKYDTYYRALSEIQTVKLAGIVAQDPKKVTQEALQKQVSDTLSDAIRAGISARDADPINYLNWISLGRVYQSAVPLKVQGAYESAQFAYTEAFRRNPKNPGILLLLSQLEVDNGNLPQARAYAIQAIQAKQNYLDAYFLLAQIEIATKNLKGAIDSVTAAAILSPNDPSILFQLGYLKFNAQDFAGAIEAFEKSLTLSPQYANAKYFLGLSYEATGNRPKAIVQFEELKQTNPESTEVNQILDILKSNKPLFQQEAPVKPGKTTTLPVKEKVQ